MRLRKTLLTLTMGAALALPAGKPTFAKADEPEKPCTSRIVQSAPREACTAVTKKGAGVQRLVCYLQISKGRYAEVSFSAPFLESIADKELGAIVAANMVLAAEGRLEREGCTKSPVMPAGPRSTEPPKPVPPVKPAPKVPEKPKAEVGKKAVPPKPAPIKPPEAPRPAPKPAPKPADDDIVIPPEGKTSPPPKPPSKPATAAPAPNPAAPQKRLREPKDKYKDVREGRKWLAFAVNSKPSGKDAILNEGRPWKGDKAEGNRLAKVLRPQVRFIFSRAAKRGAPEGALIVKIMVGTSGYVKKVSFQGAGLDDELVREYTRLFSKVVSAPAPAPYSLQFTFRLSHD